jgi:hypothetical protein
MSTSLKRQEEEMTQALYAHMNNKTIKIKKINKTMQKKSQVHNHDFLTQLCVCLILIHIKRRLNSFLGYPA